MTPTLKSHPLYGLSLAGFGALVLTPDALFIRLSEMGAWEMLFWRGILMGSVMYCVMLLTNPEPKKQVIRKAFSKNGLAVSTCQFVSTFTFILGISQTSVSVILFALATSPIFGAFFSSLLLGERTHISTWAATIATLGGILITVSDASHAIAAPDGSVIFGAICGLTAAAALGLNFVILRKDDSLPVDAIMGNGAYMACIAALLINGTNGLLEGKIYFIAFTAMIVLPLSFYCLTSASRYIIAANIGLLMLLETILGPIWVWLGVGEQPTMQMIAGGVIVIVTLAIYVSYSARRLQQQA